MLDFLWQLFRLDSLANVAQLQDPEMRFLSHSKEIESFNGIRCGLSEKMVISWLNLHLGKAGSEIAIATIDTELTVQLLENNKYSYCDWINV